MKRFIGLLAIAAAPLVMWPGLPPRLSLANYTAHDQLVGASVLPSGQVAKVFSDWVARDYVVVEVAVFPASGQAVDLDALDFALDNGAGARTFATIPEPKPQPSSGQSVHLITEAGVSVGSKAANGSKGIAGYGAVAVDNRPAPPPAPANDPYALEARLRQMAFPAGQTDQPAAGYLYFPKPGKAPSKANSGYVLEYSLGAVRKTMSLR